VTDDPEKTMVVRAVDAFSTPDDGNAAPVFVDETGRRGRRVRWVAYIAGAICLCYLALVGISLAGGPISSDNLLPFPDLVRESAPAAEPTQPGVLGTPSPTSSPKAVTPLRQTVPSATPTTARAGATNQPPRPNEDLDVPTTGPTAGTPEPEDPGQDDPAPEDPAEPEPSAEPSAPPTDPPADTESEPIA